MKRSSSCLAISHMFYLVKGSSAALTGWRVPRSGAGPCVVSLARGSPPQWKGTSFLDVCRHGVENMQELVLLGTGSPPISSHNPLTGPFSCRQSGSGSWIEVACGRAYEVQSTLDSWSMVAACTSCLPIRKPLSPRCEYDLSTTRTKSRNSSRLGIYSRCQVVRYALYPVLPNVFGLHIGLSD
jgi:hypothetical protein